MSESQRFKTEGVSHLWLESGPKLRGTVNIAYRPAALAECLVNFRSLRAGLNHSEDRSFSAWVPEGQMAIDAFYLTSDGKKLSPVRQQELKTDLLEELQEG